MVISQFRRHCLQASITACSIFSRLPPPGLTMLRSVTSGIKRSTFNSTAFSTSQRKRSPLGTAVAKITRHAGGSVSLICRIFKSTAFL